MDRRGEKPNIPEKFRTIRYDGCVRTEAVGQAAEHGIVAWYDAPDDRGLRIRNVRITEYKKGHAVIEKTVFVEPVLARDEPLEIHMRDVVNGSLDIKEVADPEGNKRFNLTIIPLRLKDKLTY